MRQAFIKSLVEESEKNKNIYLIVADLGYGLVEPFSQKFPDRFINVGIAEQNMIGIAAGLALSGKTVFCYSIANFSTLRCLEQIRNDVCYHNLNVNIVAGSTGVTYGALGSSHHALEDIAVMRALPNMTIIAPADKVITNLATKVIAKGIGPCYLRLGNTSEPIIYKHEPEFRLGKAVELRYGVDVLLISTGSMLSNTLKAAEKLVGMDIPIKCNVLDVHTIKPLDINAIITRANGHAVVTVEEHSIIGGLGSEVAEILAESSVHIPLKRIGFHDKFITQVGNQEELLEANGLSVDGIVKGVLDVI
jgi:transketolase